MNKKGKHFVRLLWVLWYAESMHGGGGAGGCDGYVLCVQSTLTYATCLMYQMTQILY